ncbi:MAG: hypothetical protein JRJ79_18225 [Deltaproteobacteria bacterium]|nr:hypothetical protein [Deltaproteobacteria bacterium]
MKKILVSPAHSNRIRLARAVAGPLSIVVMAAALIAIFSTRATAALMTECCVDCHVVHAWQDRTEREKAATHLSWKKPVRRAMRMQTAIPLARQG